MTGFINFPSPTPLFPALAPQAWSVHKEPRFDTQTAVAISGREYLIARRAFARWTFTVTYGGDSWLRDQTLNIIPYKHSTGYYTELEQLVGLYLQCLGSYGEFYYDDPDDDSRTNVFVATGNGSKTSFIVYRPWGTGPFSPVYSEPVGGLNAIDAVWINGVLQSSSTYSIGGSDARQITFTSAPANNSTITASYHYFYRCRFSADVEDFSQWAENDWEKKSLKFESVKF